MVDAVPEGVAGLGDVDVRPQARLQPDVRRQPAACLLGELVDLVEGRARGGRVAGAAAVADGAVVLPVEPAEVDVARGGAGAERAAVVEDVDERTGERGGRGPPGEVVDAGAVGDMVGRRQAGVGERHGPARLQPAAGLRSGAHARVGQRVDAARDLPVHVVVLVLEGQHCPALGVDERFPAGVLGWALEGQAPHQPVDVALARPAHIGLVGAVPAGAVATISSLGAAPRRRAARGRPRSRRRP